MHANRPMFYNGHLPKNYEQSIASVERETGSKVMYCIDDITIVVSMRKHVTLHWNRELLLATEQNQDQFSHALALVLPTVKKRSALDTVGCNIGFYQASSQLAKPD